MSTSCIVLQQKGTIRQTSIESLEITDIAKVLRRVQQPEKIGEWISEETHYAIYGYLKGNAGTKNKHVLLSPYDETELYGDILILTYTEDGALHDCTTKLWEAFLKEHTEKEEEEEENESESESESEKEIEEEKEEEEKEGKDEDERE